MKNYEPAQAQQERQYEFPYHYIPRVHDGSASQFVHWSWGYQYLAGIKKIFASFNFTNEMSVLDIGCGDGRFLSELKSWRPGIEATGIDYSDRAVALAKAFNEELNFIAGDIKNQKSEEGYDVVTLIEVLEHIRPDERLGFLSCVKNQVKSKGKILITVPHINTKLHPKHFEHFSSHTLLSTLGEAGINVDSIIPFDKKSMLTKLAIKAFGGGGKYYLITNKKLNNLLFKWILRQCMINTKESTCQRLLAVCSV